MVRRVLVTGSSKGIGLAIAQKLSEKGFEILLNGRNAASEHAKAAIGSLPQARFLEFDVGDRSQCRAVLENEINQNGAFYGVVLNAGITADAAFPALDEGRWDTVINTNLNSFYNVLHPLVLPMIQLRDGGRIVAVSSLAGVIGNRGQVAYSAAKAGLIGASKALSRELAKRKITVNCIAPGPVETEMLTEEVAEEMRKMIPLGRSAKVQEVAASVDFLFGDDAAYITGQVLTLSGGMV